MRRPGSTSRLLLIATVVLFGASTAFALTYYNRFQAARAEASMYSEASPFTMSVHKTRDRDYTFTVENYGYVYRGVTGNLIDDSVLVFGAWEKHILFFLEDYAKATGTQDKGFVDVGANTGQYTLFMAPRVKEVHAIEPFPPVLRRLHDNLALNKFANVKVHELGLGDKEGTMPFLAPAGTNHGVGTFREGPVLKGMEMKPSGDLRIATADDVLKDAGPIGTMKMDIEGFEEAALKGMRRTLEKHRPMMVLELTTPPAGTIGSLDQLKGLFPANYEFLVLAEVQSQFLNGRYTVEEFGPLAAGFFKSGGQRNLVIVPAEYAAKTPRRKQ